MPLTTPEVVGTNISTNATNVFSPTRTINAGERVVLGVTERNVGVASIADSSGNTYTLIDSETGGGDGFVYFYESQLGTALTTAGSLTITMNSAVAQTACLWVLADVDAFPGANDAVGKAGQPAGTTFDSGATTTTTTQATEYALGVAAFAASSVDSGVITVDSPWTKDFEQGGAIGYASVFGSRVLTATGTPNYSGGWGASENGQGNALVITLTGTVSGGTTITSSPTGDLLVCGNATTAYLRTITTSPVGDLVVDGSAASSYSSANTINSSPTGSVIIGGFASRSYTVAGSSGFHPAIHGGWF